MKIELWPTSKPIAYARNARKISDAAVDKVAASIKEFGFRQPIVVDGEGVIVAGHTRLLAAKKLDLKQVPVHVAAELTPSQVKTYRLMDNRSHQESDWDLALLGPELLDLKAMDLDLTLTGFDSDELDMFMAEKTDGLTDEDDAPAVPEFPVTVPGDLWILGKHRLLCGDSTVVTDVERLMGGGLADLCIIDPPYNVDYTDKTKEKRKILNDNMDDGQFAKFLADLYGSIAISIKDGASVYVFHADMQGHHFRQQFIEAGFHLSSVCIWKKSSLVMGRSDFHWKHEPVLYGWKEGASHGWQGDRKQSTIWEFDKPSASTLHPTMKPVALIKYPIELSSKSGDMVVDLCGGSGSTLIACEQTGRNACLMELEPKYCDVICQRWQDFTGKEAVLEGVGRTFNDISPTRVKAAA